MEIQNKNQISQQLQILETITLNQNTDLKNIEAPPDKEILQAFNSKKIIEANYFELDKIIVPAVSKSFALAGKRDDKNLSDQLDLIYRELPSELRSQVPSMRLDEIPLAIKRGIYKEYGEYYGLNVAELVRFCLAHFNSIQRTNTVKAFQKPIEQPAGKPTRLQRWPMFKENLFSAYDKFVKGQNYEAIAPSLYDTLSDLKLIDISIKEKYDLMELAAGRIISDCNAKLVFLVNDYDRKPLKYTIETIQQSINRGMPIPDYVKMQIIAKCKKLSLDRFFITIVDSENLQQQISALRSVYLSLQ